MVDDDYGYRLKTPSIVQDEANTGFGKIEVRWVDIHHEPPCIND